jgi:hypothetical protein
MSNVLWEWEQDDGTYTDYDAATSATLEAEYVKRIGAGLYNGNFNNHSYDVDFSRMTQKNLSSGKIRAIRRTGPSIYGGGVNGGPPPAVAPPPPPPPPTAQPPAAKWQYEDHNGNLKDCASDYSDLLEAKYTAGQGKGVCKVEEPTTLADYFVDFDNMSQIRADTGKRRRLSRQGPAVAFKVPIWEWQDSQSNWQPAAAADAAALEKAFQDHHQKGYVKLTLAQREYIVDFEDMKQFNAQTGTMREIRRTA